MPKIAAYDDGVIPYSRVPELSESLENYIEAIYQIILEKNAVRAKEIAKRLSVKGSSVTAALRHLEEKGLINYEPYGTITLTPLGNSAARQVLEKHRILEDFFHSVLGVESVEAGESACKVEHVISGDLLKRLVAFSKFIRRTGDDGESLIREFQKFYASQKSILGCDGCLSDYLDEMSEMQGGR
jgi:DtxR family transcriptional regulator, Mn-dependent transcriptional regulator